MKIHDDPQFGNLSPELGRFFHAGHGASFFDQSAWYDIVASTGLEPLWRPRLYASDEAVLVAAVRNSKDTTEIRGCCNLYTIDHSVLIAADCEDTARAARRLATELAQSGIAEIAIPGLDRADRRFGALLDGFKDAGFAAKPFFSWGTWHESVTPGDFDAYFAARPSVLKNTWRRKRELLEKLPGAAFATGMETGAFIAAYEAVCRQSWKQGEPFPEFIPALIRAADRLGALRTGVLNVGDVPIAAQFWIVWGRTALVYKLSYDSKWSRYSPGTLLTMEMIRQVIVRDRPVEIGFGRGDDAYKKLWAPERRERWGIETANPRTIKGLTRSMRIGAARLRNRLLRRRESAGTD